MCVHCSGIWVGLNNAFGLRKQSKGNFSSAVMPQFEVGWNFLFKSGKEVPKPKKSLSLGTQNWNTILGEQKLTWDGTQRGSIVVAGALLPS